MALALAGGAVLAAAGEVSAEPEETVGQSVYVPIHSEVPFGDRTGKQLVRATVVVRNVDTKRALKIHSVVYYSSDGERLAEYVESPVRVPPLGSRSFAVPETDTRGGATPSMIVRWRAEERMPPPVIEGLMISVFQNLGISFRTEGRELTLPPPPR